MTNQPASVQEPISGRVNPTNSSSSSSFAKVNSAAPEIPLSQKKARRSSSEHGRGQAPRPMTSHATVAPMWTGGKPEFLRGIRAFNEGNYDDALKLFTKSLELGGRPKQVLDSRAACYQKMEKLDLALKDTRACIGMDGQFAGGYLRASRILEKQGRLSPALSMLEHALKLMKSESEQYLHHPRLLVLQDRIEAWKVEESGKQERRAKEREERRTIRDPGEMLPMEIWGEILTFGVDGGADPGFGITCASVSKGWRANILRCPEAWQHLILKHDNRSLLKARTYMERSGGRLKSIVLSPLQDKSARPLSTILQPAIPRLRHFKVSTHTITALQDLISPWKDQALRLESLIIHVRVAGEIRETIDRLDHGILHDDCQTLRVLHFHAKDSDVYKVIAPPREFLPSQIENLEEVSINMNDPKRIASGDGRRQRAHASSNWPPSYDNIVWNVIRHGGNLRRLHLSSPFGPKDHREIDPAGPWPDGKLFLPRLELFSEDSAYFSEGSAMANWIETPAVTSVRFVQSPLFYLTDVENFCLMTSTRLENLKSISLKGLLAEAYQTSSSDFFSRCHAVELLDVEGGFKNDLLEALYSTPDRCPKLTKLVIQSPEVAPSYLMKLVDAKLRMSRRATTPKVAKIQSLTVIKPHIWDKEAEEWLRRNVAHFEVVFGQVEKQTNWTGTLQQRAVF